MVQAAAALIKVLEAAESVQQFCRERKWRFCFIGGIALQRWGEPRLTPDVDLTLLTGFGGEEKFIADLLRHFRPRMRMAAAFALEHRVLLVRTRGGVDVDIALGGLPYEESVVDRGTPFAFRPRIKLVTCSAEDLVVLKAFADRPQDWVDVENVLARQGARLDWTYVVSRLTPLVELKETPGIIERLKQLHLRSS